MKSIAIAHAIAISLLLASTAQAQAANVFKYTFTIDATATDPEALVTIRAGVKVVKRSTVTVCSYFGPSDQYLGQYQATDNPSTNAGAVQAYCLGHFIDSK